MTTLKYRKLVTRSKSYRFTASYRKNVPYKWDNFLLFLHFKSVMVYSSIVSWYSFKDSKLFIFWSWHFVSNHIILGTNFHSCSFVLVGTVNHRFSTSHMKQCMLLYMYSKWRSYETAFSANSQFEENGGRSDTVREWESLLYFLQVSC